MPGRAPRALLQPELKAAGAFDEAVAAALAALDQLKPARGAVAWLNDFDATLAQQGESAQFAGGRLEVVSTGLLRGRFDPSLLLKAAATVTREKKKEVNRVGAGTAAH